MEAQRVRAFVSEFADLTRDVSNEDELRHRFASVVLTHLGLRDLKIERDRQDVRRNRVIIEFKDRGLFHASRTSSAFRQAASQLTKQYIPQQAGVDRRSPSDYIGVCFDGDYFAFAFIEQDGQERVTDLVRFDEHSAGALLEALEHDDRIELTPENVIGDFGPGSAVAAEVVSALWDALNNALDTDVNRVQMLYAEWNDLFEQTANLGQIARARLDSHLASMGIPSAATPTKVLFVLHTYHALVFKLLAAETVLANVSQAIILGLPSEVLPPHVGSG